jgi:hypothetical protein
VSSCICFQSQWGSAQTGRCRSSVVEHSLGKGEVESSILSGSTRFFNDLTALGNQRRIGRVTYGGNQARSAVKPAYRKCPGPDLLPFRARIELKCG